MESAFLIIQSFEKIALALKNRVCPEIFSVFKYFSSFRIFELLALALKTVCPNFFRPGGAAALPAPPPRTPLNWGDHVRRFVCG